MDYSSVLANFFQFAPASRRQAVLAKHNARPGAGLWQKIAVVALVMVNCALFLSYLVSVNNYASSGYEMKQLQVKLAQLTDENNKLNVKTSEVSSMITVQSDFLSANFVPAGTPTFLQDNQLTRR